MLERYPRAAAYLRAERESQRENFELSEIGKAAVEEIINGDYVKAIADMDAAVKAYVNRHMFD